jgi:secreted protein with Ig-like and vWFA domain
MKSAISILLILSIALNIYLFLKKKGVVTIHETTSDTLYLGADTIFTERVIYRPTLITEVRTDTIFVGDTAELIDDYFTKRSYSDTIIDDEIKLAYYATITCNHLADFSLSYQNLRNTQQIINTTIIKRCGGIGAGILIGNQTATPLISYQRGNMTALGGYNFANNSINFGGIWQMKR